MAELREHNGSRGMFSGGAEAFCIFLESIEYIINGIEGRSTEAEDIRDNKSPGRR